MYEKPQYLTPFGFRRMEKGPGLQSSQNLKKSFRFGGKVSRKSPGGLSPEAAQLVAMAIKAMLHSR